MTKKRERNGPAIDRSNTPVPNHPPQRQRSFSDPFFSAAFCSSVIACAFTSASSIASACYLVAERALDAALDVLTGALGLLCFAFGHQTVIVGRLADGFLDVAGDLVAGRCDLVGEFAHRSSPAIDCDPPAGPLDLSQEQRAEVGPVP
ncbi:hypothetical protein WR25_01124 [Diploscapter pachys]|uniref:Uncharacterized protein n=1 Tax=Diploscapter pachys TaxID=2018661 RepID=A0A2A2M4T9_9BILA|nr:hypothetical protein WR25_01124 [Diploscapter pachys]